MLRTPAIAILIGGSIGCSFAATTTPSMIHSSCMASPAPVLDLAIVVVAVIGVVKTSGDVQIAPALAGAPFLVSALYGLGQDTCPDPATETRPTVTQGSADDAAGHRETARELTNQAAAAARAGNCDVAKQVQEQVRSLDRDFHDVVFFRDVAIARCLGAIE